MSGANNTLLYACNAASSKLVHNTSDLDSLSGTNEGWDLTEIRCKHIGWIAVDHDTHTAYGYCEHSTNL
jgi:hypothetical protein